MAPLIDNFDQQLTTVYESALASGDLIFTASETHKSKETEYDIEVQTHRTLKSSQLLIIQLLIYDSV
jgi:hypothetical protein